MFRLCAISSIIQSFWHSCFNPEPFLLTSVFFIYLKEIKSVFLSTTGQQGKRHFRTFITDFIMYKKSSVHHWWPVFAPTYLQGAGLSSPSRQSCKSLTKERAKAPRVTLRTHLTVTCNILETTWKKRTKNDKSNHQFRVSMMKNDWNYKEKKSWLCFKVGKMNVLLSF